MGAAGESERTPLVEADVAPPPTSPRAPSVGATAAGDDDIARRLERGGSFVASDAAADKTFWQAVRAVQDAIDRDVHLPQLIVQGSSGSYFARDARGRTRAADVTRLRRRQPAAAVNDGVFKPRDEEPYGQRNPKLGKYIHRTCFPCCFGRSCLVPATGYLSEAGASVVDAAFALGVVPPTKVVYLASPTFNYHATARRLRRRALPPKVGSFQTFVRGYRDACDVLPELGPLQQQPVFLEPFQRLVVLDYLIRNTDRGPDNWLIHYEHADAEDADGGDGGGGGGGADAAAAGGGGGAGNDDDDDDWIDVERVVRLRVAAIDNGLAFPMRHPSSVRAYPYSWTELPAAREPFLPQHRQRLLPLLRDDAYIESLLGRLRDMWAMDRNFTRSLWRRIAAVFRGQVSNLREALSQGMSPAELVRLPPCVVVPAPEHHESRWHRIVDKARPCFSRC